MDGVWTLGELSERVAGALADGYQAQASGRVRDVPDPRTIRWYTTTGLVDRPAGMRGRTALYGRRHMLQLLAIKRLQAAGHSLAEIQQQLLGASDSELAALAGGAGPRPSGDVGASLPVVRKRFWAGSEPMGDPPPDPVPVVAGRVYGVALADGVTLLLPQPPADADLSAISAAAQPLLDTLRQLELTESFTKGSS
jgi:DNA-binding transcriptional MerR regulator